MSNQNLYSDEEREAFKAAIQALTIDKIETVYYGDFLFEHKCNLAGIPISCGWQAFTKNMTDDQREFHVDKTKEFFLRIIKKKQCIEDFIRY